MRTQEQQRRREISSLLERYRKSGLTRSDFCEQAGIAVSTLDYYRRLESKQNRHQQTQKTPTLVEVQVEAPQSTPEGSREGFTLELSNGRRIEASWKFEEAALARLIRIVEEQR